MAIELSTEQIAALWDGDADARAVRQTALEYYEGKQAILQKTGERKDGRPYSKTVMNWVSLLVDRQVGFNLGKAIDVGIPNDAEADQETALEQYIGVHKTSDLDSVDMELFRAALIAGYGVELHSYDGQKPKITSYSPLEWVFAFDSEGAIQVAVRRLELASGTIYKGEYLVEGVVLWYVYNTDTLTVYRSSASGSQHSQVQFKVEVEANQHFYGRVPVVRFFVTQGYLAFVSPAFIGLQDAYNTTLSLLLDDNEADIDSMLALYGLNADQLTKKDPEGGESAFQKMRRLGALVFPDKDSSAEFITKGLSTEKPAFTEKQLRQDIHDTGRAPDLSEMVGSTGATSGIALKLKFQAMVEAAQGFAKFVELSVKERIVLLNTIWEFRKEPALKDFEVKLNISLPANETEIWKSIGFLESLLSRLDRARLVPSIENPEQAISNKETEEAEQVEKDQAVAGQPGAGTAEALNAEQPAGFLSPGIQAATLAAVGGDMEGVIEISEEGMADQVAAILAVEGIRVTPDILARIVEDLLELMREKGLVSR